MDAIEQVLSVHAAKQEATKQEALRILKAIRGSEDSGRIEELQRKASL